MAKAPTKETFPNQVRLFGVDWKINWTDFLASTDPATLGQTNHVQHKIDVAVPNVLEAKKTFLHELIHVCEHHTQADFEEEDVVRLENALFAVFKDNPGLARFLFE